MSQGMVTAGAGHGWETSVVTALSGPGSPLTVVGRCADMADVVALATTGQIRVCLVAADLQGLDSERVAQLTGLRVAVVAVHRPGDAARAAALDHIGVAASVPDDASPVDMIALATGAIRSDDRQWAADEPEIDDEPGHGGKSGRGDGSGRDDASANPGHALRRPGVTSQPVSEPASEAASETRVDRDGAVVAVWGPQGAPGRTTIAMGLAGAIPTMAPESSVMLIDADVYGGVMASAFGLLDESAGLAGACRLANSGELDSDGLAELCWAIDAKRTLLTGIARADRWPEVRPSAIPSVLDLARRTADVVVVDVSALLERDEEITFDTLAPRRNGATLAILDEADVILAVAAADPPGMERFARGLTELADIVPDADPPIVANRVRPSAASVAEVTEALQRFCGRGPMALLPEDRAACDRAWRRGRLLSVTSPKSSLTAGIADLATTVLELCERVDRSEAVV